MKRQIIIIFSFAIVFSCEKSKQLDNSFLYNTEYVINEKKCIPLSNTGNKKAYEIYNQNLIFSCNPNVHINSSVFLIKDKNDSLIKELSYPNDKLYPWLIGYDKTSLISFKEVKKDQERKVELIRINLKSKELNSVIDLPNENYRISKHPISENNLLVFTSKGSASIFDFNSSNLKSNLFKCDSRPVISKDGKLITYIKDEKVYLYDVLDNKEEMIFDLAIINQYKGYQVYFKNKKELIIEGNKHIDIPALERSEYVIIKNKKIIDKGQLIINNGYKYY